jgi:hypothetical protein
LTAGERTPLFQPTKHGRLRALESVVYEALHGSYRRWASQAVRRRCLAGVLVDELADACGVFPTRAASRQYPRCLNDPREGDESAEGPPHPRPAPGHRYCHPCHQAWEHVGMDQATAVNLTGFRT